MSAKMMEFGVVHNLRNAPMGGGSRLRYIPLGTRKCAAKRGGGVQKSTL